MDNATIGKVLRLLKADNVGVQRAVTRLKARGLSDAEADAEITQVFLLCLSELDRGIPNRFADVMEQIAAGRMIAEIFPDEAQDDLFSDRE